MTKAELLKEIENKDDMFVLGNNLKVYLVYNPNNGNDDNAKMWKEESIILVDKLNNIEIEREYEFIEEILED